MRPGIPALIAWCVSAGTPVGAVCQLGQELEAELLWEQGGVEVGPEAVWVRVASGAILADAVFILDMHDPSVRQFDLEGRFVAELGRQGAGPGEYERPAAISAQGDSVAVWDLALRRLALFDRGGRHLETRQLRPYPNLVYGSVSRPFVEGSGLQTAILGSVVDDGVVHPGALIQWSTSEGVDTLALLPEAPLMGFVGGQWNRISWFGSLGPVGFADRAGPRFVVVDGEASTATFFDRVGEQFVAGEAVRLPGAPSSLSERDQAALIDRLTVDLPPDFREFRLPDVLPAWSGLHAGGARELWLREGSTGEDFGNPERWVRWEEGLGVTGAVSLRDRETLLDADGDLLLVSGRGDFDETYVRLYRVQRAKQ